MKTYPGIDYTQRPTSYWEDGDPLNAILRNVEGTARRAMIRDYWKAGRFEDLDKSLLADLLGSSDRVQLGQVHPSLMGGEYLPGFLPGEREIARIELESTTEDVISIRARPFGKRIRYRIVDEYETEFTLARSISTAPLTLAALIRFLEGSRHPDLSGPLPRGYNDANAEELGDRESLRDFTRVTSDLYPQLEAHYEQVFEEWVEAGEEYTEED